MVASIDMLPGPHDKEVKVNSFDRDGVAIIFGISGGIGGALLEILNSVGHFRKVIGFSRQTAIPVDLLNETSVKQAIDYASNHGEIRLAIDGTGFLHCENQRPEKSWCELNTQHLAHAFNINAIGPALLMKHLFPYFPRSGKSIFATLSARVGSITDNRLGGWYGYRASKAALNQLVRTASIELARRAPEAICVALHPGTVATSLSAPFVKPQLDVLTPSQSAHNLLAVIERLDANDSGNFFDWRGKVVPW